MDLALNSLQRLICHKTQTKNQNSGQWVGNQENMVEWLMEKSLISQVIELLLSNPGNIWTSIVMK